MPDFSRTVTAARPYAGARTISTAQLLGQVMFLVAVAIGFLVVGTVLGRDLSLLNLFSDR